MLYKTRYMIKRILSLCMALLAAAGASAQQDARIGRTEAVPYDMRHDAEARNLAASGHTLAFRPVQKMPQKRMLEHR